MYQTSFLIEYTDTYGGEANYSWVRRETFVYSGGKERYQTSRSVMRKAKALMGLSGLKGRTYDHGDLIEFRPYGMCTVLFVQFCEA